MRARNIKPGFFINCELSEVDFASRLLFIGLWCYADREGRFEWKPKQIKAAIFPYDNVKIDNLLCNLMSLHFITCHDGVGYVENFKKHQSPHPHEAKTRLPEKPQLNQCHDMSVTLHEMSVKCNADVRMLGCSDIMNDDTNNLSASDDAADTDDEWISRKKRRLEGRRLETFKEFWEAFDYKRGRAEAIDAWLDIPQLTNALAAKIVEAAASEARGRGAAIQTGKTPKMAQGWISGRRWEDDLSQKKEDLPF